MLADTQNISMNAVVHPLTRTVTDRTSAVYTEDGPLKLTVSHAYGKRIRRSIRLDYSKVGADPLLAGVTNRYSMSTYLVVDVPLVGFTTAEVEQPIDSLAAYLGGGSGNANLVKILGGSS